MNDIIDTEYLKTMKWDCLITYNQFIYTLKVIIVSDDWEKPVEELIFACYQSQHECLV